jgi:hypothetical protein
MDLEHENQDDIELFNGEIIKFKTADELSIKHFYIGNSKTFDGSGYQMNFPYNTTAAEYQDYMTKIFFGSKFFNPETLTLVLMNFDMYVASLDLFYCCEIAIEMDPTSSLMKP